MPRYKILLVDDDESLSQVMEYNLKEAGYEVQPAYAAEEGLRLFPQADYALVISDIKLPGMDGLEFLHRLKTLSAQINVVMITAFGSIEKAVTAMKSGALDYITKPFNKDEFLLTVQKALERYSLYEENRRLKNELGATIQRRQIITLSPKMQKILEIGEKVARSSAAVLINGESGTGKELLARFIHFASDRADQPFIPINCAAIPRDLLESELFGFVKGAFSGAQRDKRGKFESADGGTAFLDEIGELPPELQKKLLRVLQEGEIEPLGAEKPRRIEVRIIAATNRNLEEMISQGQFREDLYYRINVIPLEIPPLRERPEDIPLLVKHFLKIQSPEREIKLAPGVMEELTQNIWKGNVRELENVCKRMTLLSQTDTLQLSDLPWQVKSDKSTHFNLPFDLPDDKLPLEELEREVIVQALNKYEWNQSKAAQYLQIPRHVLVYRLEKFNIQKPEKV
ncbi:MAG: sigma-54-dependent Fis family transcriptional regulator [Candidatus Schekmanbacteria bacterium]|nr:sigma-54-dependent Fis family transcriptional regulator [Candidatus Schekmanbacteria bacterium]